MIARFCAIVKDEYSSAATMLGCEFLSSVGDSSGFSRRAASLVGSEAWVSPASKVSEAGRSGTDAACPMLSKSCRSGSSARSVMADCAVPCSTTPDPLMYTQSLADGLCDRTSCFGPYRRVDLACLRDVDEMCENRRGIYRTRACTYVSSRIRERKVEGTECRIVK